MSLSYSHAVRQAAFLRWSGSEPVANESNFTWGQAIPNMRESILKAAESPPWPSRKAL